jgi:hypothetical protein
LKHSYVFVGLRPFIERAAADMGVSPIHVGRALSLWHATQIQDTLGQLPKVDAAHRKSLLDHAIVVRDSLAAALAGIDAAIDEVDESLQINPERRKPPGSKPRKG